ncbi:MAG: glycosyltransferase [Acidobacteria bacterium]|nr:glycosyltransferase [Acidobacteriota bacterium]
MDRPEKPPLVSVIVPARNEEQNIADCLHSLLEQGSGIEIAMEIAREIIVADDGSEDKTATIVTQIAAAQPRGKHVKLVSVPPLPPGWVGPGEGIVSTRMYRRFTEMWEGWTKNLFLLYHGDSSAVWRTAAALPGRYLLPSAGFE